MSFETVGLLASFFALVMFMSPIDQIQSIRKIKKSDEVSPAIYMAIGELLTLDYLRGGNKQLVHFHS
jgi:Sugar efflux transporter for intercellular exchange